MHRMTQQHQSRARIAMLASHRAFAKTQAERAAIALVGAGDEVGAAAMLLHAMSLATGADRALLFSQAHQVWELG